MDAQLDVMVSAYLETLGLEKKIADEAIKGGSSIVVDIKAPEDYMEDICITKEDETTGYKFSKPWSEFYDLLVKKILIEGVINCSLSYRHVKEWIANEDGWVINEKHLYHDRYNPNKCNKTVIFRHNGHTMEANGCPFDEHHPIHNMKEECIQYY